MKMIRYIFGGLVLILPFITISADLLSGRTKVLKVFNANRVDDEKQMVQFLDQNCKYIGESNEVKSGQWIINVKERV